jgi:hypothetical protein
VSARTGVATLALLACLCAPAGAQDERYPPIDGYEHLPEARWGKLKNPDLQRKFYVEGRWLGFWRPGIRFWKNEETGKFLLVPGNPGDPIFDQVTLDRDSRDRKLEKKRSMVRIFGTPQRHAGRIVLLVDSLERMQDEHVQYKIWLQQAEGDLEALRRLGAEARQRAKAMDDPQLAEVADSITKRELAARAGGASEKDYPKKLELAQRYDTELQDPRTAIRLYGEVREARDAPRALRAKADRLLKRRNAVRLRSKSGYQWVTYSTYKHSEGFIYRQARDRTGAPSWSRRARWVTREWAEFEDAREEEMVKRRGGVQIVRNNGMQHAEAALRGEVERGQNQVEVLRALGEPVLVNHAVGEVESKQAMWTQWVSSNGSRIYFLDGEVISFKTDGEPWPQSEWAGE